MSQLTKKRANGESCWLTFFPAVPEDVGDADVAVGIVLVATATGLEVEDCNVDEVPTVGFAEAVAERTLPADEHKPPLPVMVEYPDGSSVLK